MSTLFPKNHSVVRTTGGLDSDGVWVPGTPVTIAFTGSVQPMSMDAAAKAIGRETEGACKIFSSSKLQTNQQEGTNPGDVLTWQGHKWELVKEGAFDNGLIPHYTYVAECRGPV